MPSPYSKNIPSLFREIRSAFTNLLVVETPYRRDDIKPGERFYYLRLPGRFTSDRKFNAPNFVLFEVDAIFSLGFSSQAEAEDGAGMMCLDIPHEIALSKSEIAEGYKMAYNLELQGNTIETAIRQPTTNRNCFIADLFGTIELKFALLTNADGSHRNI